MASPPGEVEIYLPVGDLAVPTFPSVVRTSQSGGALPPCSVRDQVDQVLRRPPSERRLIILLSQASYFQQSADPPNAMGIFPQELCRAQVPVTLVRVGSPGRIGSQGLFQAPRQLP
jgi:hypothetical protein